MTPDPIKVALKAVKALESLGIRYLVGGSLASSLYGIPRATQDVDVVAQIEPRHLAGLVRALEGDFYVDAPMASDAVTNGTSFNIIDKEELFKIDIFPMGHDGTSVEEMQRRVLHEIAEEADASMYLCSAEDIVAHKLYWFQSGGGVSERQWHDALNVLKVQQKRLDLSYLKRVASARGVLQLLDRALRESDGGGAE